MAMGWNRDKWNQFVSDNTEVPPTDVAAEEAIGEAKVLAETHEEDIDLDALGVQQVKQMLEELAPETPGPQGSDGPAAIATPNGLTWLAHNKQIYPGGPVTPATADIVTYQFGAGEMNGTGDLLVVECYQVNLSNILLYWEAPGGAPSYRIFTFADDPTNLPTDGYITIYVSQARTPLSLGDFESSGIAYGKTVHSRGEVGLAQDWMDLGYKLRVNFVAETDGVGDPVTNWGGQATIYKFNFPSVVIE